MKGTCIGKFVHFSGEGRIRTFNAHRALVLQTNVFTISNKIAVSASVEAATFFHSPLPLVRQAGLEPATP